MANETRLIDANALLDKLERLVDLCNPRGYVFSAYGIADEIGNAPTVDAVSRGVHDQVRWERDVAMKQLEEHGISFGGIAPDVVKVVRCKDCRSCKKHPTSDKVKMCTNENWNTEYYPLVHDNDFCSCGERRENEKGSV